MFERLAGIFEAVGARNDLRAVVLCVEGDDLSNRRDIENAATPEEEALKTSSALQLCDLIEACRVPVIAAVRGLITGVRCAVGFACHMCVASEDARFEFSQLDPATTAYVEQRLKRLDRGSPALETILAGDQVEAREALRIGLINRVVARESLRAEAEALAGEIASLAPLAIRACLEAVTRGSEMSLEEGLELEAQLFSGLFATDDMREGTRAFLEKRSPEFKGQ
jgi:enoyl-CoA hydratase